MWNSFKFFGAKENLYMTGQEFVDLGAGIDTSAG
jgi:hypothetical protein